MALDPALSRAAADAYQVIPGMRDVFPPARIEKMKDVEQLLTEMRKVNEDWPGRLVAQGRPLGWVGAQPAGADTVSPDPTGEGDEAESRFIETGEGLEIEEGGE